MKVSELITRLQRHLEVNGEYADYDVWIQGLGPLDAVIRVSTSLSLFSEHIDQGYCHCFDCTDQRARPR